MVCFFTLLDHLHMIDKEETSKMMKLGLSFGVGVNRIQMAWAELGPAHFKR